MELEAVLKENGTNAALEHERTSQHKVGVDLKDIHGSRRTFGEPGAAAIALLEKLRKFPRSPSKGEDRAPVPAEWRPGLLQKAGYQEGMRNAQGGPGGRSESV